MDDLRALESFETQKVHGTGECEKPGLKCSQVCDLAQVAGAPELKSSVLLMLDLTSLAANPPQGHINSFNLEPPQYAPSYQAAYTCPTTWFTEENRCQTTAAC